MPESYTVDIPFKQFCDRFFTSENATDGPWGDNFVLQTFSKYITDAAPHGFITIDYKYAPVTGNYTNIKWRVKYTDKVYRVRYAASTEWAAWWCALTDELEDEEDEEEDCDYHAGRENPHCPECRKIDLA